MKKFAFFPAPTRFHVHVFFSHFAVVFVHVFSLSAVDCLSTKITETCNIRGGDVGDGMWCGGLVNALVVIRQAFS